MNKSADKQVVKSFNIYQLNITLRHIKPRTWRRIQVKGDYNFKDLHYAIQDAMGWKDCHLHQFEMINPKTGHKDLITELDPDYTYNSPIVLEDKAKIAEYFLSPKDKAIYEYDLGDSWTHDIVLEQILPAPAVTYPQCLAGKGACPEEDDDRLCYSSTDKFDPKSVQFKMRECQGNRLCPPEDCEEVDRGNDFNAGDSDDKLIRSSNDANADLNNMNEATEASLNDKACQTEDCGVVNGCINFNSKDPDVIRRSIAEYLYRRDIARSQNNNAKDFDPKLTRLSNDVGSCSHSANKARGEQVVKSSKIYQFKIILHYHSPKIWRRVQVPGDYSFKELHKVIQKAMGWSNSHLHQFTMKNSRTREEEFLEMLLDPAYDSGEITNERETKIAEKFLAPKDTAIYEYDLGASWMHDIVLERILPAVASITYPRCLAGRRRIPIEHPTESEHKNGVIFYPSPNGDKFDPKSVKFTKVRTILKKQKKS